MRSRMSSPVPTLHQSRKLLEESFGSHGESDQCEEYRKVSRQAAEAMVRGNRAVVNVRKEHSGPASVRIVASKNTVGTGISQRRRIVIVVVIEHQVVPSLVCCRGRGITPQDPKSVAAAEDSREGLVVSRLRGKICNGVDPLTVAAPPLV
jgi:hypothetical protein